MRISTVILISAMLLLLGSLGFYNWQLVAQYRKGGYTDPLYQYVDLKKNAFDQIELRSANAVSLTIVQGDFKVLANPQAEQFLVVQQVGRKLIISARFEDHWRSVNIPPVLYISCPALSSFMADATYFILSDTVVDRDASTTNWMTTYIKGFTADSLTIKEEHAANIILDSNKIGRLTATLGRGLGEKTPLHEQLRLNAPAMTIENSNQLMSTDFQILSQSRLSIKGTGIRNLTYYIADSASLTLNGVAARHINLH